MSTLRQYVAIFLLPAILFGYAAYSNAFVLLSGGTKDKVAELGSVSMSGMLDGEVTKDLDSLYKRELPHRDAAVGLAGNARYALFGTGRKGVVVGSDGWLFTNEEFRQIGRFEIEDAVLHIAEVKSKLAEMGVTLVVLPLPAKSDVYREFLPKRVKYNVMAATYADFLSALGASGIHAVDTRSTLLAEKDKHEVFLRSDTHWSPFGANVTARAADSELRALGIELTPGQIALLQKPPVSIWGDLTKYITLPEYASEIGLKPESVAQFRTQMESQEASLDLFGDNVPVSVMLVGTSYSANENWSFVDYLRQALSVDVVNVAKEGLGPGIPIMELLNSDILSVTKPKIVFWEFPVRYLGTPSLWKREKPAGNGHETKTAGGGNA